ncbi:hypothetical protein [Sphingomonas sp. VDB2]|uniref:hypothetical protein n=1 Tax=Sphingomonas sp. VDB2 TaxID=3228751 RepID=UPI003A80F7B4
MTVRRPRFKQADLTRAAKGAVAAGLKVGSAIIGPDGTIKLIFGDVGTNTSNSFDEIQGT